MKKKKKKSKITPVRIAYYVYILVFLTACAVPGAMLLRKQEAQTQAGAEKRMLAEMPSFRKEDGSINEEWSAEFLAYVSDPFGFRPELVQADAKLKADLLHVSAEEQVIIGTGGWLYYTPTVNDYIGNPTVSRMGIQNIIYNLKMSRDYVESKGSQLVIAVVPNKNTVYPSYMPYNYRKSGAANNLDNLTAQLRSSDLTWCDLAAVLKNAAVTEQGKLLYHKQDTHWNNFGALLGYRAMMQTTGREFNAFSDALCTTEQSWQGDLQNMLYPGSEVLDTQYVYDIPFTFSYQGHYRSSDDININTQNPDGNGSLLMFRDSFGAAVIPYFSQNYASARYSRARPNPYYQLEQEPFDTVIMEIVERNIAWLQKEAPMHAAPAVETPEFPENTREGTVCTAQNGSMFLQIYGTLELPEQLPAAADYIVTLTAQDGSTQSYLAYHCYEADLLEEDAIGDNGYSLYVPTENLIPDADYDVTLTLRAGNVSAGYTLGTVAYSTQPVTEAAE